MLIQRLPVGVALSVVLLTGACGDDNKDVEFTQDASSIVGTPGDGGTAIPDGSIGGKDGSVDIDGGGTARDGSLPDGATAPVPAADSSVPAPAADSSVPAPAADSSVPAPAADSSVPAPVADSSVPAPATDSSVPAPVADSSVPAPVADSSVPAPAVDSSVPATDAGLVVDGSAGADSGAIPIDAAAPDASVTADAGPCPINHPSYGCGHAVSASWVVFDNGLEIDRVNKRAWTPVVEVIDDDAVLEICTPLALGGLTGYSLPQQTDVRTLAAGCAATLPGGSCQVYDDMEFLAEAPACICPAGVVGPNNGKFCRPEVPDCETLWAWTHTFETGWYHHWFYDVTTGSIVPEYVGVGIANTAKGRCVRALTDAELP
jgi:hypothetical protein